MESTIEPSRERRAQGADEGTMDAYIFQALGVSAVRKGGHVRVL